MRIHLMFRISFIVLIIFSSCHSQTSNKVEDVNFLYNRFVITNDYNYLDSIYSQVDYNSMNITNSEAIISTFMYLKKYSELDSMLIHFQPNDSIFIRKKEMTHNIVKHLNRKNLNNYDYIHANISVFSERTRINKKDSLAYLGECINLIYIQGKEKTLNQIDTLEKYNKSLSASFYENYLRKSIKDYPEEFYNIDKINSEPVSTTPIATSDKD